MQRLAIGGRSPSVMAAVRWVHSVPKGFRAAGVAAGIKKKAGALDMALVHSEVPCNSAIRVTQNVFKAAPVLVSQETYQKHGTNISSIIINAGYANACTGVRGMEDARATQQKMKDEGLGTAFVMSTGVIGPFLPMEKIKAGISKLKTELSPDGWENASKAIMTTDTVPKLISKKYDGFSMIGMAKGAGMINPNLATMLSIVATDAKVDHEALSVALGRATDRSFNSISVDGDSSTNDTIAVLANGLADNKTIQLNGEGYAAFEAALTDFTQQLAKLIVRDGEGATKFVTIRVQGAKRYEDAHHIGRTVAKSCLVKTAFYGEDANWGRILCAIGYAGIQFDPTKVSMWFGEGEEGTNELQLVKDGNPYDTNEDRASAILKQRDISVRIKLGEGNESATLWTCDLSNEYVNINADYRS